MSYHHFHQRLLLLTQQFLQCQPLLCRLFLKLKKKCLLKDHLLLARTTRRLADDWAARYAYRPVLLETFVDADRFPGTCYRAANWLHVGTTQGRGKLDRHHTARLPRKDIYLFPLSEDFRTALCS